MKKVEHVQGLLNGVYLPQAENNNANKVKIEGDRQRLPSKSANIRLGFELVTDRTAEAFAALCCETDATNSPKIESGRFKLDPVKYRRITEPYMANLGIVSDTEKLVNNYESDIQKELYKEENLDLATLYFDDPMVKLLLNIAAQKEDLRAQIYRAPKSEAIDIAKDFTKKLKSRIKEVVETYKEQEKEASEMMANPLAGLTVAQPTQVSRQRDNTGAPRASAFADTAKSQENEKRKTKGNCV